MDSLDPKCTPLKQLYEACFYKWYTNNFLNPNNTDKQEDPECLSLFRKYRECLEPILHHHQIIGPDPRGSP